MKYIHILYVIHFFNVVIFIAVSGFYILFTLTQMFCVCNSHHTMPTIPIVAVKERQIKKSRGPMMMMRKASIMTGFLCSARKMRAKRTHLIRGTKPT